MVGVGEVKETENCKTSLFPFFRFSQNYCPIKALQLIVIITKTFVLPASSSIFGN
jgi:hypothetical protein